MIAAEPTESRRDYRDEIAEEIIRRIEAGTAPWQQPWVAGTIGAAPFNPTSGQPYRGINDVWLTLQGRADPRWLTYKQAAAADAQVRKGEKSTTIEYWQWTAREPVVDGDGKPVLDAEGRPQTHEVRLDRPRVFYAKLFNAEQIDGLAPYVPPAAPSLPQLIDSAETMISSANIPVFHDQRDRAYYSPTRDEIHLPDRAAFRDQVGYYETVLHELGHATGHASRLNRSFGPFGSEGYAREELRAEIASYMLARDLGISFDPSNHAAYVESWLKALREDRNEIFRAAKDAEIIKTWVMEPERRPELERAAGQQRMAQARAGIEAREQEVRQTAGPIAPGKEPSMAAVPQPRVYLTVPYAEKNAAQSLGAKWDGKAKSWYVPEGRDPAVFAKWNSPAPAREPNQPTKAQGAEKAATPVQNGKMDLRVVDRMENYFRPGRIVPSYGGIDEVVAFRREGGAGWEVDVQAMENGTPGPVRTHWTKPSEKALAEWEKDNPPPMSPRIYLDVPFDQRNAAKLMGAEWDREVKSWYVPADGDPLRFSQWLKSPVQERTAENAASVADSKLSAPEPPKPRAYLAVPFAAKDEAKALGAKWDRREKSWYITPDQDPTAFAKWAVKAAEPAPDLTPQEEFAQALKAQGLIVKGEPEMDGRWHRVPVEGDKGKDRSGVYRGFLDGRPAGNITNYKAGAVNIKWVAAGVSLTTEEQARIQAQAAQVRADREAARLEAAEKAAKTAYGIWKNLPGAASPENCAYLAAKGVGGHGVKVTVEGRMVVPCRTADGKLWNVQFVGEDKHFLKDSLKIGTFHVVEPTGKGTLDTLEASRQDPVLIAEGYATAARIHESVGRPVVVAFDSGNLQAVAEAIHARFPGRPIVICADNDHANVHGNVGMTKAGEAAQAVGGTLVAPIFSEAEKAKGLTDFDDLGRERGNGAVAGMINTALRQHRELERGIA
jgi:antirestriction protein ArdC/phage/plasmid primase-like uncharacterized protein